MEGVRISTIPKLWEMVRDKKGEVTTGRWPKIVTVSSLKVQSGVFIWWKCKDGKKTDGSYADDHEWEQEVYARWNLKKGKVRECPFCTGHRVCKSNSLGAKNPKLAEQWHPDNLLTIYEVSPLQHDRKGTTYKWKCKDGKKPDGSYADDHEWNSTVANRNFRSRGCPYCAGKAVCLSNSLFSHTESNDKEKSKRAIKMI